MQSLELYKWGFIWGAYKLETEVVILMDLEKVGRVK
jgi:hypothetical protein